MAGWQRGWEGVRFLPPLWGGGGSQWRWAGAELSANRKEVGVASKSGRVGRRVAAPQFVTQGSEGCAKVDNVEAAELDVPGDRTGGWNSMS